MFVFIFFSYLCGVLVAVTKKSLGSNLGQESNATTITRIHCVNILLSCAMNVCLSYNDSKITC